MICVQAGVKRHHFGDVDSCRYAQDILTDCTTAEHATPWKPSCGMVVAQKEARAMLTGQ